MPSNQISNVNKTFKLGWTDIRGNPLDWRYWQRQKRISYWKWEEVDEADCDDDCVERKIGRN